MKWTYTFYFVWNYSVRWRINSDRSVQRIVFFRLSQCFSLWPTLFNIYFMMLVPNISSLFFADTTTHSAHQNFVFATVHIHCAIQQILEQTKVLNLTFPAAKSSTISFSLRLLNSADATLACDNNIRLKFLWNHNINSFISRISPLNLLVFTFLSEGWWIYSYNNI